MKLLNKSIRAYLVYSIIVLFIAVPVFYFVLQGFVSEEVDEGLSAQKEVLVAKLSKANDPVLAIMPETLGPGISLTALSNFRPHDTIYSIHAYDEISQENIPFRVFESNILVNGRAYRLKLSSSLLDSEELIQNIVAITAILMVLTAAGLLIINRQISKKIWKPFYNTLNKLRGYQIDKNEPVHFEKTKIAEFADLNAAINTLTERNRQIYQLQKEFTENASHEMQTPLAIFQAKLELLMQTTPLNGDQAGLIGDLADASQQLNRYNKNLLLLTKIDNNLFLEKEQVSIREVVTKLTEQYQFQVDSRHIQLHCHYDGKDSLHANRTLVEILFGNLLSNSIRYNREGGTIDVSLVNNVFMVKNTGADSPLDGDKIFNRFHRESTDVQSVGLGLAISKKIVTLYNYQLSYQFENGLHVFSVQF